MSTLTEMMMKIADGKTLEGIEREQFRQSVSELDGNNQLVSSWSQINKKISSSFIDFPISLIFKESFPTPISSFSKAIPSDYNHLIIFCSGRTTSADAFANGVYGQFNGDTGNNYSIQWVEGHATTASAGNQAAVVALDLGVLAGGGLTAGFSISTVCFVMNYSDINFHKTVIMIEAGYNSLSDKMAFLESGYWSDSSPIKDIKFTCSSGNFAVGSTISVYGIK